MTIVVPFLLWLMGVPVASAQDTAGDPGFDRQVLLKHTRTLSRNSERK